MTNSDNSFLHLIKTPAISSDGRLLKWVSSLSSKNYKSSIFALEDQNDTNVYEKADTVITTTSLKSRKFFKKGKGYWWKIPEFTMKTLFFLKKHPSTILVFHDVQHYLTLLILVFFKPKGKFIVWDLHELPHRALVDNIFARFILRYIINRVNVVIYTNDYRKKYVLDHIKCRSDNCTVLHNYPDVNYLSKERQPVPDNLKVWLKGRRYILWMGMASSKRNFLPFYKAIAKYLTTYRLVIIGNISNEVKEVIQDGSGFEPIYQRYVAQNEIINYIDNAAFSAVFYKATSPNNSYCEPNRLYQLLTRGVPTIGGNNPQIAFFINECRGGIVLSDDGTNVDEVKVAVDKMIGEKLYSDYKLNLDSFSFEEICMWESDFEKVFNFLESKFHPWCLVNG